MKESTDRIDMSHFVEPTTKTRMEFSDTKKALTPFAQVEYKQDVVLKFTRDNTEYLIVDCAKSTTVGKDREKPELLSKIQIIAQQPDDRISIDTQKERISPQKPLLDKIITSYTRFLDRPTANWVRNAYLHTQLASEEELPSRVEELLDTATIPKSNKQNYSVKDDFANGASINGYWVVENEGEPSTVELYEPAVKLTLRSPKDVNYIYTRFGSGKERLDIYEPNEVYSVKELRERDRLGVNGLTDRKLATFTEELQTAITSGNNPTIAE